jgi:catechol 2,3-dioxygenase-like lactoylglutathione lyase family enzyme
MKTTKVLETCLYVDDLARAERFYTEVLGLTFVSRQEGRHAFFRCGQAMVLLFNPLGSREERSHDSLEVPTHGCFGPGHVAFAVRDTDLPAWAEHLERHGVAIERTMDWPDGGRSLYFRDPAGNSLELATPRIWGLPDEPAIEAGPINPP